MDRLKPRAVIFDMGNTLVEWPSTSWEEINLICLENSLKFLRAKMPVSPSSDEFFEAYNVVRGEYRRVAEESMVEWTVPQVVKKMFDRFHIDGDSDLVDRFFDAFYEPVEQYLYVRDDVIDTLDRIKARFEVVGLISNTVFPEKAPVRELERFSIFPYLDFTLFSSTFGMRKPHPDIYLKGANLAGVAPAECVYIGDRYLEDVVGPSKVGMPAVLKLMAGQEYPEDMPGDLRTIETLSELNRYLDF